MNPGTRDSLKPCRPSKGSAMVIALGASFVLIGLALAFTDTVMVDTRAANLTIDSVRAEAVAQAALNIAIAEVKNNKLIAINNSTSGRSIQGQIGSKSSPYKMGGAEFYTTATSTIDTSVTPSITYTTITAYGKSGETFASTAKTGGATRKLVAMLGNTAGGIYWYAIFSGNDPNGTGATPATLLFSGTGTSGDNVVGGVYSGSNITVQQNAAIRNAVSGDADYNSDPALNVAAEAKTTGTATITTAGLPSGISASTGAEPIPDLSTFNYEANAAAAFPNTANPTLAAKYVNVKKELDVNGTDGAWTTGGTARQITSTANPAHIFRRNPDDRTSLTSASFNDDYFLEDPTVTSSTALQAGTDADASFNQAANSGNGNAYPVNLTSSADVTRNGSGKVYFIDGNLWINNSTAYSFVLKSAEANGERVTFVAKGNIYLSDNFYLQNLAKDGVAFIAIKDPANPNQDDTGNIIMGDPQFGTLRRVEAFLYAQNDFVDNNITSSGSSQFTILGNMTAGDDVRINRDSGSTHSRMDVFFDSRIRNDAAFRNSMPGIPVPSASQASSSVLYIKTAPYMGNDVE